MGAHAHNTKYFRLGAQSSTTTLYHTIRLLQYINLTLDWARDPNLGLVGNFICYETSLRNGRIPVTWLPVDAVK